MAGSLAALTLAASASPTGAAVTIGQVGDASGSNCLVGVDWLVPSVKTGNSYVVPGAGTITSWTMNASGPAGQQLTMKMYRKIADPATYQVVGHAGPQTLTPGPPAGNTFPANIQVKPGDVLGFHTVTDSTRCGFPATGEQYLFAHPSDLGDGESGAFTVSPSNNLLNIQATFVPDNSFTLGAIKRNKKKGTATLTATVPNPGDLTGSGKGVKVAGAAGAVTSKTVTAPGEVKLTIRAKGKKKRTLNETGKVKVKPKITYTPTGGDPATQSRKLKLKKR